MGDPEDQRSLRGGGKGQGLEGRAVHLGHPPGFEVGHEQPLQGGLRHLWGEGLKGFEVGPEGLCFPGVTLPRQGHGAGPGQEATLGFGELFLGLLVFQEPGPCEGLDELLDLFPGKHAAGLLKH